MKLILQGYATLSFTLLAALAACNAENAQTTQPNSEAPGSQQAQTATDASQQPKRQVSEHILNEDDPDATAAIQAAKDAGVPPEDLVHLLTLKSKFPDHAHGMDVSHHQGEINWERAVEAGIDFVYIKATEGIDYQDPLFEKNWKAAGEAGLRRGAYHMFRPEDTSEDQAKNFLSALSAAGIDEHMLAPVLDIERVRTVDSVPRAELQERAVVWLKEVEAAVGAKPVIYTNPKFWEGYLASDHELTMFPLWISEYDLEATSPEDLPAWESWTFWQFSRYGIVPGVPRPVDLNRFCAPPAKLTALTAQ